MADASAGFCSRATAFLIDLCVLLMILGIFFQIMLSTVLLRLPENFPDQLATIFSAAGPAAFAPIIFIPAYFTVFHALSGATPGKLIMGIRVVSLDNETIRPGISFLRVTGYLLSGLPMALGFLWVLLDPDGRAWHDKLAGTRVVYN